MCVLCVCVCCVCVCVVCVVCVLCVCCVCVCCVCVCVCVCVWKWGSGQHIDSSFDSIIPTCSNRSAILSNGNRREAVVSNTASHSVGINEIFMLVNWVGDHVDAIDVDDGLSYFHGWYHCKTCQHHQLCLKTLASLPKIGDWRLEIGDKR